jgi:hypothetical protein
MQPVARPASFRRMQEGPRAVLENTSRPVPLGMVLAVAEVVIPAAQGYPSSIDALSFEGKNSSVTNV